MSESSGGGWGLALAGLLLGAGVAFAGWSVGGAMIGMKKAERSVFVRGLSERDVKADVASWNIGFRGKESETAKEALETYVAARDKVSAFLKGHGFSAEETQFNPPYLMLNQEDIPLGEDETGRTRYQRRITYTANGAARVRTSQIEGLRTALGETQKLLDDGVWLGSGSQAGADLPQYYFTKINDLKPDMIAEATKAARAAAEKFAADSGARLGGIASAEQGVVQIQARDDSQGDEKAEIDKKIRVIANVRYYLED